MKVKQFIKKIICIVVVFTMLVGNFISPVISIANELNESEKANITETNVEPNNNNEGGEEQTAGESTTDESNSVDETQAKIDEIDAAFEASQEKAQNGEEPGGDEESGQGEESQSQQDNEITTQEPQVQQNNTKGLRNAAPVLRGGNSQATQTESDKIEDRITPDKIDEIEEKAKNDAYEINTLQTEFVSGAENQNGRLIWTPSSSAAGHEFTFRVNYAISGLKEHLPETIKITIPKQILLNRNGEFADKYMMSLPTAEEYDGSTEFAYIENEDYIIVYNPNAVTAALNGYFEISYSSTQRTFDYFDYNPSKLQTVLEGGTASNPFNAVITLKTTINDEEEILARKSDDKNIFINTNVVLKNTQKNYPTIYREWDNSWTEEVPEDKDEYYYLVWTVVSNVGEATQRYNFSLVDTIQNITEGTANEDYQFVGYKLYGEKYYTNKNTATNQVTSGNRYDSVLTKHKKSTFNGIKYSLKNTINAKVDPVDQVDPDTTASASNVFSWDPSFVPPVGAFYMFKYGNNNWSERKGSIWDYANYDLDKLKNGEVNELTGFLYITETVGYAYPWTLKEGGSLENPEDYGYNPVYYDTWDDTLNFEDDTNPMTKDDYYIDRLSIETHFYDAEYDDFNMKFNKVDATYEDDEIITYYGKFNGSDEWQVIGTYNLKTRALTKNNDLVTSFGPSSIVFKPGVNCTGWRLTTANKHLYSHIIVNPYVVLKGSDYILQKSAGKDSVKIKNTVHMNVKDYKNEDLFDNETSAVDYARVTYYNSEIKKSASGCSNDKARKQFKIRWRVDVSEKATSGTGNYTPVLQESGRIYDLIPKGAEVDLNSIIINSGYIAANECKFELISNYNNSGRTLLVIDIPVQAYDYTVYYTTIHPWYTMIDYGRNVLNPVAYETGNEKIANGYPDNGGNLSAENRTIFNDLDKTTNANKFIYAEEEADINGITAATAGLDKKVKNEDESSYSYETEIEQNGNYSYQLRYQNTFMNKAKDLVFYDSMENFEVVNSANNTITRSSWKGTIQSIDFSQLINKGIKPELYISTIENLDLEENRDLSNTQVWTKVNILSNISNAKAIAIDMSKDLNGNDFILNPGDSVIAKVYMKAPEEVPDEADSQPYTFNNIYIANTLIDELNGSRENFIHQDYTKVRFHWVGDVYLLKVNEEDETQGIKDITFRLQGTSIYGNEIDEFVVSNSKGKILFNNIEAGEYKLQEYEATPDWLADYTEYNVRIGKYGAVYIDDVWVDEATPKKITNHPRIHADVKIKKRNLENSGPVQGAKFKLSGTSEYGTEILMYSESNTLGEIAFDDLEYGTYELKEVKTAEGYIENINTYRVIVDENGNYDVSVKLSEDADVYGTVYENGSFYIFNEPYHKVRFIKKDAYTLLGLKGAEYRLYGVSDYGNSYNQEKVSNSLGFVEFDELEPGTYILQETKAPELVDDQGNVTKFVLDGTKHLVTVDRYGNFTISESEKNDNGYYEIYNERNKGQIVINKEWVDESNNDERPEPTVYISNEKPVAPGKSYAYLREGYEQNLGPFVSLSHSFIYWVGSGGAQGPTTGFAPSENVTGTFSRNVSLDEEEVLLKPDVTRIDKDYNDENAKYKIYAWIENDNIYWWSNAEVIRPQMSSNGFQGTRLSVIDCTDIDFSGFTVFQSSFYSCSAVSINLKNSGIIKAKVMNRMFRDCGNLETLDLSNFDTREAFNMQYMFAGCGRLRYVYVSELFSTETVTDSSYMFDGCSSIIGQYGTGYDSRYTDKTYAYAPYGYFWQRDPSEEPNTDTPENPYTDNRLLYSSADTNYDPDGNIVQWIKDGNNWKYIFYVDDPYSTWWAWEDDLPGYYSNFDIRNPEEVENQEVDLINYIFRTRNKVNVEQGSLEISKTLIGVNANESTVLTNEEDNTEFTFVVTLTAPEGKEELISGTKIFGNYVFNNGICVLKIHAGETVTITGLPNKVQYKVTERKTPGYEIGQENYYGTIKTNETSRVEAYNYKSVLVENAGFRIIKKDKDTNDALSGAKYKLTSTANSGNNIEIELVSNENGEIEFNNLGFGTYILKEITAPSITNDQGNTTNYLIDSTEYVVSVDANGIVTIDGIEKDEHGNFILYNEKNKGQITITKIWMDDKDNESRPEPVVHISNKKPEKTKQYFRDNYIKYGSGFSVLNYINESVPNSIIKFIRNTDLTEDEVVEKGAIRLDREYENENAEYKIYSWVDENNVCYWWSNADVAAITDSSNMLFSYLNNITEIDLSDIDTSEMTDMSYMFYYCYVLTDIDLTELDTSNVTNMEEMFAFCYSLEELDFSAFDTSKVDNMYGMFYGCSSLTYLNLEKFDTSNVTEMTAMFSGCGGLTSLDISSFNTSNVTGMSSMFSGCSSLTELDVSSFDTRNVISMENMFQNCTNLTDLDLENFDTTNVTHMAYMFQGCSKLTELDLSSFNTENVSGQSYESGMDFMFDGCSNLVTIYVSENFVTDNLFGRTQVYYDIYRGNGWDMFNNCTKLVGGNGTGYDSNHIDKEYAHIDKSGEPGYFTQKTLSSGKTKLKEKYKFGAPNDTGSENNSNDIISYSSADTNYDNLGNEVHWIKNGNIWTYTFYVDNPDDILYAWEDEIDGYKTKNSIVNVENQNATITNYTETYEPIVKYKYGKLQLSKKLIGVSNEEEIELTKQEDDTKFVFTIVLNADETRKSLIKGKKVFGGYVFNDGVTSVQLSAGESITIEGIPEGITYTITERNLNGYNVFKGASGTIGKNQTSKVKAINYKDIRKQAEQKCSFRIVKKDYTSKETIQGAKFILTGTSDYANSFNEESISDESGSVEFKNIEPGSYILQETFVPEIDDGQGDTIKYVLDNNQYMVEIGEDGTTTIKGIEKENNEYVFYNKRDNGQIVITKKWIDNSNNTERVEPIIKISNKKPEPTTQAISSLSLINADYASMVTGEFKRKYNYTEEEVIALGGVRIDAEYDNENAEYKIYGWIDENGNLYWWSNADFAEINGAFFQNMSSVKNIDLNGISTKDVTDMKHMFNKCSSITKLDLTGFDTSNVTTMQGMFFGCSNLKEVNLSSFNTSKVTDMGNMFNGCINLLELDLSSFDTSQVTQTSSMFVDCQNLRTIYVYIFDTSRLTGSLSSYYMFYYNYNLVGGNGTYYQYNQMYTANYARIDSPGRPGFFTRKVPENTSSGNEDDEEDDGSPRILLSTADTNFDNQNNEVNWVKVGDTWTYSFYIDGTYDKLYVWENGMDGYYNANDILHPGIIENNKYTVHNYPESTKKFVMSGSGSILLSKSLVLREGTTETTLTSDDDNTEFTFKVELSASGALKELLHGTKIFGDYIFKDGIGYIVLKAGETAQIPDIPAGISYNITELHSIGYDTFEGASGTIIANETANIQATNYKLPQQNTPTPETSPRPQTPKYTSFTLAKKVTGNGETDDIYNFEIILDNLEPDELYYLSNGQTFTSDSIGSANVSVSLKNNESVIVQNIPVGAKYKVYEYAGDYISSYVITDANNTGLINNTAKNNTKENKDLSTNTETADEGEDVTITFTDRRILTQNLKVRKTVTDTEDTNSYMFDIEFANLAEGTSIDSTVGRLDEEDGKIEITIYLAGGEEAGFYNIPVGTTYVVKELASTAIASYTITDANGGNNIVSSSKANTAARKALSTERETVNQGEEATVTFINDTVNQEPDSVSTSLGVTKNVVDADGEKVNNCDETFTFELTAEKETNPMPEKTSVEIKGSGEASFGTITFDSVGTYIYTVVEKAGTNGECTYDNTVYTIVYEVTNAEGLLEITKTVKRNGFIGDVVEFTNIMPEEDEPDTPDNPDTPDKPDEPVDPDKPDEPVTPDEPTNPDKPEQPEEPENKDEDKPAPTPDKPNSPQTGDNIIIAVVIGMLAIMVFVVTKKKSNKGKHF